MREKKSQRTNVEERKRQEIIIIIIKVFRSK